MNDLQILTGLSILVSGYTQLKCGLSTYHWQILVNLAWFSSVTHLSCLAFLRNHLYNHQGERLWRLLAMGALLVMLIVAELPTGNYEGLPEASYAICFFQDLRPHGGLSSYLSYESMIFSIVFLGLGFISRVVRLHRSFSVTLVTRWREYLSNQALRLLRALHGECKNPTRSAWCRKSLRMFVYRPALAAFLSARCTLDLWASLMFEVRTLAPSSNAIKALDHMT